LFAHFPSLKEAGMYPYYLKKNIRKSKGHLSNEKQERLICFSYQKWDKGNVPVGAALKARENEFSHRAYISKQF